MGDIQKRDSFSFAYDDESTFGTKPGAPSWNVLECEYPDITFSRTIEEFALSKSKDFEESQRAIGSSDGGTFTVRAPLTSQLSTYDPTAGTPIANPLVALIEDVFGSVVTGSTGLAIAGSGSDGNTWELASGTLLAGSAYAAGTGSGFAVSAMGFTQDVSGGTTIEFREDNRATPAAADDVYPMRTLYAGTSIVQPTSKTFALFGDASGLLTYLTGCMPQQMVIEAPPGATPIVSLTYTFTGYELASSGGGLQSVTSYMRLPPLMGNNATRLTINGGSTGTPDATGNCGVAEFTLTVDVETTPIRCHAGTEGISNRIVRRRMATIAITTHHDTDYITNGDTLFGDSLVNSTNISLTLLHGDTAGKLFAVSIPNALVKEQPSFGENEGLSTFSAVLGADTYTGDTGTGAAADSPISIAFG